MFTATVSPVIRNMDMFNVTAEITFLHENKNPMFELNLIEQTLAFPKDTIKQTGRRNKLHQFLANFSYQTPSVRFPRALHSSQADAKRQEVQSLSCFMIDKRMVSLHTGSC
jgi:hypothetical protein